jgi:hypothetical protein
MSENHLMNWVCDGPVSAGAFGVGANARVVARETGFDFGAVVVGI